MRKKLILVSVCGMVLAAKPFGGMAQLSVSGQLRTRTELRDGYGTLNAKGTDANVFTSQRARLIVGYKWDRVNFNVSVQDVRVWGQDASTISNADGNKLMVHEAWAEVTLLNAADSTIKTKGIDNLSFKIGRQALIYDDARLLGDLDWLQQARRHDALLIKALHHGWQVDIGAGFNQNSDAAGITSTYYVPGNLPAYVTNSKGELVATPSGLLPLAPNGSVAAASILSGVPVLTNAVSTNGMNQQYKAMQMLYVSKKFGQTKFAGLFFKDDFSKYRLDSVGNATAGYVYGRKYDVKGVNSRVTFGLMINGAIGNSSTLKKTYQVGAYFQTGKDRDGKDLKAAHYTAALTLQKGKFSGTPGFDYLSGNDASTPAASNHRFDPLYGTPHKFWGLMDYYYVATGSPTGGLKDAYVKLKYQSTRFWATLDAHNFRLAENTPNAADPNKLNIDKNLGYEFDLVGNYALNKFTTLELGYAFMAANNSTEYVKRATMDQARHRPQWVYLMINIRPDFLIAKK